MIRIDRNALICDLAETYHLFDLGSLPARTVAILACGLRDNSRIKMKIRDTSVSPEILLIAQAVDRLGILVWQNTKDARYGRNIPESITQRLLDPKEEPKYKYDSFDSPEEFEAARTRILESG